MAFYLARFLGPEDWGNPGRAAGRSVILAVAMVTVAHGDRVAALPR